MDKRSIFLSDHQNKLTGEVSDKSIVNHGKKRPPQLGWSTTKDNKIKCTVYTNMEGDNKNKGMISTEFETLTDYNALMDAIAQVSDDTSGLKLEMPNKRYGFGPDGRSAEPFVGSRFIVGKNDNGEVFIALVAKDRPKIPFTIKPKGLHSMLENGEPMSPGELSRRWAKAYAHNLKNAGEKAVNVNYKSWKELQEEKEANKNPGGGKNYNSGSDQTDKPEFDEDVW